MSILKPILTEKSQLLYQKHKIYTFAVLPQTNKFQIKQELKEMFPGIKIKEVRTCRYKPVLQKGRYSQKLPGKNYTKLRKKALIELMPNSKSLEIFENKNNKQYNY